MFNIFIWLLCSTVLIQYQYHLINSPLTVRSHTNVKKRKNKNKYFDLVPVRLAATTEYTECQAFSLVVRIGSPRPLTRKRVCCPFPLWFQ
jgi:hypothetical protein